MANTRMIPVPPNFDMDILVQKITQKYQLDGFTVVATPIGTGVSIEFKRDKSGFFALDGISFKANIMVQNDDIFVSFSDVGMRGTGLPFFLLLFFFLFLPGLGWLIIVGLLIAYLVIWWQKTDEIPKSAGDDIQMIVFGMK